MEGIHGKNPSNGPQFMPTITDADLAEAAAGIKPLLGEDPSVKVSDTPRTSRVDDRKGPRTLTDVPEIDDPDGALLAIEVDLEALIALLTAEEDEKTLQATKKRIESLKSQIEQNHTSTMKKIKESMAEMKKQEKAAKANKILGWLGVAVGFIVATAMIFTVGGAAAGFAMAGALLGAAMQIMTDTGVMDKWAKAIAKSMAKTFPNMSKEARDAWSQGIVAGICLAVTLATSFGAGFAKGGAGLVNASAKMMRIARMVRVATVVGNSALSAAGLTASVTATLYGYHAQQKQADVTEMQKVLLELQTLLEQDQEDLEEILKRLQDAFATVIDLLQSKQDALNQINMNIGA